MQIQFVKSGFFNPEKMNSVMDSLVKKIDPECRLISLPPWLASEDALWIFEKKNEILITVFWQDIGVLENITRLIRVKSRWSQFVNSIDARNKVSLIVFGERIPLAALKLLSLEASIKAYELIMPDSENALLLREVTVNRTHDFPESKIPVRESKAEGEKEGRQEFAYEKKPVSGEPFLKQDTVLSSFFYKMGKLSEEELGRFLEMETDLNRLGL